MRLVGLSYPKYALAHYRCYKLVSCPGIAGLLGVIQPSRISSFSLRLQRVWPVGSRREVWRSLQLGQNGEGAGARGSEVAKGFSFSTFVRSTRTTADLCP